MTKRIQWVDIARGIAILAVIVGHTLGPYSGGFLGSLIFAFHMPIFFVLSGYLYHPRAVRQEARNGAVNLLLPYLVTSLLILLVNWGALHVPRNGLITPHFTSTKQALLGILYGAGSDVFSPWHWQVQPIGAIWFLLSMFLAVQLFNATMQFTKRFKHVMIVRGGLVFLYALMGGILGNIVYLPWAFNAALLSQFFLFSGYVLRRYDVIQQLSSVWYVFLGFMWLVSAFQGYFALTVPVSPNLFISTLGGVAASLCIIHLSEWLTKFQGTRVVNLLEKYGRLSLIILCFHLIDLDVVGIEGWLFNEVVPLVGNWLATVIGITYRIGFATFWMVMIPKVPVLRAGFLPRKYLTKK
ncbi:acetyltransferase [Lactiplantibacillus garii]|uniref:Acetyltransferase n=1 Tax=Lactiplantibacillus garii TaxID=2306423 RepID=A0A426D473_9LACO|nr:acyltransferase family protein [Lactiplantibacillus garii]RRK09477.1 acetyltransferase [Lactiplantibacillus garii]